MKISNPWKIFLWILGTVFLMTMSSLIVYYATRQPPCPSTSDKLKLEDQKIQYLGDVVDASKITEEEANKIKSELKQAIINQMMTLDLTENIDYEIKNLDALQSEVKLSEAYQQIEIEALPTSEKASGSARKNFQIREDMSNRSINNILIPDDQKEEITEQFFLEITKTNIKDNVQLVLSSGQDNDLEIDYNISGLELFQMGAKFADYKDQIWVIPVESSTHLKGQFKINFV